MKKTEERIEALETRSAEIDELFGDETIATDLARVTELSREKDGIGAELETLYAKWEELSSADPLQ